MKVLFVSSEIFPFAKSGGLADVASSLPKALLGEDSDVVSIMPLYSTIDQAKHEIESTGFKYSFWVGHTEYHFEVYQSDETLFLKENNNLFNRDVMYGDYDDNDIRFGVFSYAVLEYIKAKGEYFDILHINDWQAALIAILSKEYYKLDSKIVFTIHNLAYQGVFSSDTINRLGLDWRHFTYDKLEFHDRVNFMKSAIVYSDIITTVSPTYAKEIQTKEFGCNLEHLMQDHEYKLKGILNGIDYDEFGPEIDEYLPFNYSSTLLEVKKENKKLLLEELNLWDKDRALFIFIGRFTYQKGIEQLIMAIDHLKNREDANLAILGSGDDIYNAKLQNLIRAYPNISITLGYNERLARKLYSASDFIIMPSIYEPCGLNQMIAMSYGSIPIVKNVGGLKDSVVHYDGLSEFPNNGVGIKFESDNREAMTYSIDNALSIYYNEDYYKTIITHNMELDFSWTIRAEEYLDLYNMLKRGDAPKKPHTQYEIPHFYDINTLKIIAVNPTKLYSYWELTEDILSQHQISADQLKIRVAFIENLDERVVEEVSINTRLGNYYFKIEMDFKKVIARIGFYNKNGEFITILNSNIFIAPNSKLITNGEIIWRNLNTKENQERKFVLLDSSFYTIREQLSSRDILKRVDLMQNISAIESNYSSATLSQEGVKSE